MTTITQLKQSEQNQYGDLNVSVEQALKTAYPKLKIKTHSPSPHGGDPDLWIQADGETLDIPSGEYKSRKHYHSSHCAVLAIEDARQNRLNLAKRPLFLLKGAAFNGDYRSLKLTYFLFGQNEDNSYFCHKVRPCVGETGDLSQCRAWIWNLKKDEKIEARQGDLAFIPKQKTSGKESEATSVSLGNHNILADSIKQTKHKVYALNPCAYHNEHHQVALEGWYELRLGRAWKMTSVDYD